MSVVMYQGDFDSSVIEVSKSKPVLVDFFAEWCGPCKMIAPVLEEIAEEVGDEAEIVKVNVDVYKEIAQIFQIMSIPTLIVFKNGEISEKVMGFQGKEALMALIK